MLAILPYIYNRHMLVILPFYTTILAIHLDLLSYYKNRTKCLGTICLQTVVVIHSICFKFRGCLESVFQNSFLFLKTKKLVWYVLLSRLVLKKKKQFLCFKNKSLKTAGRFFSFLFLKISKKRWRFCK